jgi:replicative DNA helicase
VVDYVNQIKIDGGSQFDWQPQVEVSKQLKNLARKYNIVMVSPYQIDDKNEARFGKGILDAADVALILEAHDKSLGAITLTTTKIRGASDIDITSPINWETLKISPVSMDKPSKPSKKPKVDEEDESPKFKPSKDSGGDVPWN